MPVHGGVIALSHIAGARMVAAHSSIKNSRERVVHAVPAGFITSTELTSRTGYFAAWHGRLDNKHQLCSLLDQQPAQSITNPELILQLYLKYGRSFLSKLLGDYGLSIWDPRECCLILARDPFGCRPLFYKRDPSQLTWCSDLDLLLTWSADSKDIDSEYVADYLLGPRKPELTPYENVRAVPPGSYVCYSQRKQDLQVVLFWTPHSCQSVGLNGDTDYEERFLYLFEEAIRLRLASQREFWMELSGGLDSSSIACMAQRCNKKDRGLISDFQTVSFVYDEAKSSDEREYIDPIEAHLGKRGIHMREDDYRILDSVDEWISVPSPLHIFGKRYSALAEAMKRGGADTLVKGDGGDQLFWSDSTARLDLADLLSKFKVRSFVKRLRQWSHVSGKPFWDLAWRSGILPNFPALKKHSATPSSSLVSSLVRSSFQANEFSFGSAGDTSLPSTRRQLGMISRLQLTTSRCYYHWAGITPIYPYLHLPLVEFCIGIPFEQKLRPGQSRSVMRRSLRAIVPNAILNRTDKRGPHEAICRALMRHGAQLSREFRNSEVVARGYVDQEPLLLAISAAQAGNYRPTSALLNVISLELWFRSLRSSSAILSRPKDNGQESLTFHAKGGEDIDTRRGI
jgi:asparagine synthase (glutamine-hydrolysing)